jgi:ankyrin repeat protein
MASSQFSRCFVWTAVKQLKEGTAPKLARKGELKSLEAMAKYNPRALEEADDLGWTPFHEGVRSGDLDVVKFFLNRGADKNALTDAGISPLWIARHYLGRKHEVSLYLEEIGAIWSSPREPGNAEANDEL